MRTRSVVTATLAGLALTAGLGAQAQAQVRTQANPPCYANGDGSLNCGNTAPAKIYSKADWGSPHPEDPPPRVVDTLRSNPSWFKCYVRGDHHSGGNNVWYYTVGDDSNKWGYVPAYSLYTNPDPFPGVRRC
ncbi:hypothetical protein OIE66_40155 [Nonomuraea sp. NBC_01738]|uniref:hypothetical protein n=1 Tax=Nonomuraea sp. NBC_01738 TaxID=2976003 RepID=UPI002E0E0F41|nr:hypothetical protein OIE66_40155 [Nonomuraea sp. NBC_01738]